MGRGSRKKPVRLAEKMLFIRKALGLSQNEMLSRLGIADELSRRYISGFELGTREPELGILLRYARVANLAVEALIDDQLDLPAELPSVPKSEGIRRQSASGKRSKK
jgi:transcriptional regulator with XRE-family HTH domain